MSLTVLDESTGPGPHDYVAVLAISGYAAFRILAPEAGLHILEEPGAGPEPVQRYRTRVKVAPQPETPLAENLSDALSQAREALEALPDETTAIVRRYRESPSPLVRDKVRGWKTGHLGRVLDGDFDLFGLA